MMLEAMILGIVQGITEFLPVSSTAHLILFPWFFGWKGAIDSLTFDVALHAGTLLALIGCFWKDWLEIFLHNRRLLLFLVIATIPAGTAGILFKHGIEGVLRSPLVIAVTLIVFGIVMLISERMKKDRTVKDVKIFDAIVIGISQAVALIPGVSRSGITISAGLFRGLKREESVRFSFLLSTPAVFGAVLLEGRKLLSSPDNYDLNLFLVGLIASAISGLIAIRFLLYFFRKHPLNIFVYYRFMLAVIIIGGIWLRI